MRTRCQNIIEIFGQEEKLSEDWDVSLVCPIHKRTIHKTATIIDVSYYLT